MSDLPAVIGRYQVLSELGHGGMGVVYLALDPVLKRKVAIKCLKNREGHHNALKRFQREAETSSRLNHPNVITVYNVGEDPDIGPYLAMEFVEGASLETLITQKALTRAAGYDVLCQVKDALEAAHAAGIIHRDVKPENLLVGKDGRTKLMDFGIARDGGDRLTALGEVLGTPSYTAPELLLGKDPTPGSDLYAFVVTAFEVMSGGMLPFKGDSLGATLYKIVHDPPTMPPDFGPGLAAVFQRGLHKTPEQRFPGFEAFLGALAAALHLSAEAHLPHSPALRQGPGARPQPAHVSPDDQATAFVPSQGKPGKASHRAQETPEPGRSLAPPPKSLLNYQAAPEASPREPAPHPPRRQVPSPQRPPPPPRPHPPLQVSTWGNWLKLGAALVVVLAMGQWGWTHYSNSRERLIEVSSSPPEAHVWVNGVEVGTTPCTLRIKAKARQMLLVRPDYEPLTFDLASESTSITKSLTLGPGFFRVLTEPSGAKVFLNGRAIGTTPVWSRETPARAAKLRIERDGFESREMVIQPNRPLVEPIPLRPKP